MAHHKPGHPLQEVRNFPSRAVEGLREYSVTTAEEFFGLAQSARAELERLLGVDEAKMDALVRAAAEVIPPEERAEMERASHTVYRTGHDAPPAGQETF